MQEDLSDDDSRICCRRSQTTIIFEYAIDRINISTSKSSRVSSIIIRSNSRSSNCSISSGNSSSNSSDSIQVYCRRSLLISIRIITSISNQV